MSWPHFLHRKTGGEGGGGVDKTLCTICFKVKGLMRAQSEGEIGSVPGRWESQALNVVDTANS